MHKNDQGIEQALLKTKIAVQQKGSDNPSHANNSSNKNTSIKVVLPLGIFNEANETDVFKDKMQEHVHPNEELDLKVGRSERVQEIVTQSSQF